MIKKYLVAIMRKHLDEALAGPYATLGVLEKRIETLETDWSCAADELDRTYKKVHSELGHISRQKRTAKDKEESADAVPPLPTPPRAPFGGVGVFTNRSLLESYHTGDAKQ